MPTLQSLLEAFTGFLNNILLPTLFTLAFALFLINTVRFFIIDGANEDGRTKAKQLAVWSISAFVFLFTIWVIVGIVVNSLDIDFEDGPPPSDYIELNAA